MPSTELPPLHDHIRRDLRALFVGINPGIHSARTGHHFAGPSNRFWRLLHEAGLVPELVGYKDDVRLPEWGLGITNIVSRPTPGVEGLRRQEFVDGRTRLLRKVGRYRPPVVALVGITVYRACFPDHAGRVSTGPQVERFGPAAVFVLPNPSGRNAGYSYEAMLEAFRGLRVTLGHPTPTP